jgi:hypothetical protein
MAALTNPATASAANLPGQAIPLTFSAGDTNASESGYVDVFTGNTQNIDSTLVFLGTQNTNFALVSFAVVLVSFICLIAKYTFIASVPNQLSASTRSTKQRKNPRDGARNEDPLMTRVVELVTRTSCRPDVASQTAAAVLVARTFAALCFSSALVRGPAAVALVVLVLVLYCGRVSYLVHCQDVSINYLAQSQEVPMEQRQWLRLIGLLALSTLVQGAAASACTPDASWLTPHNADTAFYATTNAQLTTVCASCSSITYLYIFQCSDCTTATLNTCTTLTEITGKSPWGASLYIRESPGISSLAGLANVSGPLTGAVIVIGMGNLTTVDGLDGITSVGANDAASIFFSGNPVLYSATGLAGASFPAGTLNIGGCSSCEPNPNLVCVPAAWPDTDKWGGTIRASGTCPSPAPTDAPTDSPTDVPTDSPTDVPTAAPTVPTDSPTDVPTAAPTTQPTDVPTVTPTDAPTTAPTGMPTYAPTASPTATPTALPTSLPTAAGYNSVFEVNANMTLSGFATADDFTSSYQTAMEKALSQEIGQSATVTDVTDAGGGVIITYHVYLVASPDTAEVLKAITQIAANETDFVSVVTEKFDDEDVATPSGFGVDAARAVETTKEVKDGKYFSKLAGKWQLCPKGKSPNVNKDSCNLCPEGSYSTEGVCVECNEGDTASALRDRCDQELDDPLYKQVRELYRLYLLTAATAICEL